MTQAIPAISFAQTHVIAAPPDRVAAGFVEPAVLKAAVPRCKEVRQIAPGKFWVAADVGILKMVFEISGMLTVTASPQQVVIVGPLRTRNIVVGALEATVVLSEQKDGTGVDASIRLTPVRKHGLLLRRAGLAVGWALMTTFFVKFAKEVTA